jgi:hypothetical protein
MPARLPAPHPTPSSGSMDNARVYSVVKSPDLAVAIRATFSGHQVKIIKDGILTSARAEVGQYRPPR